MSRTGPTARRITLARANAAQRHNQLIMQQGKIALYPAFPANQHMIGSGQAMGRQQFAQQGAKAALHAVAHHGIADFLGDGHAKTHLLAPVRSGEQYKAGS